MKILALDGSSSLTSIAMVDFSETGKKVLYSYQKLHERCDSSVFFKGFKNATEQCGTPDRIVIGLGPGSYNGLRSSIAAAQGMASALGIDLIGIPSPLGISGPASGFWIGGDARGQQYWLAAVQQNNFLREPFLLASSTLPEKLAMHPEFPFFSSTELPEVSPPHTPIIATPDATLLAALGLYAKPSQNIPEPLYLKSPCIGRLS